jgi:hypothetical protein
MTDITLEKFQSTAEVKTQDTLLKVDVSPDNPLPVGPHVFELEVIDKAGNRSAPARVQLIVRDSQAPTAVLNVADSQGRILPEAVIEMGAGFMLSAKGSQDLIPGTGIENYTWRLVS